MPQSDQATIDLPTGYFQEMEVKDQNRGVYYATDITQTLGQMPPRSPPGRDTGDCDRIVLRELS